MLCHLIELTSEGNLWWHRLLYSRLARLFILLKGVLVVHELLDVTGSHERMEGSLEAAHVRSIEVLALQRDRIVPVAGLLSCHHRGVIEHPGSFCHSAEQSVALFIDDTWL